MGVETALLIGALAGAATSAYTGSKQVEQQKKATNQAKANADTQAKAAEQDMNRRNAKQPNTAALFSANQQEGMAGASGTMLTGAAGVNPEDLMLGKNTLLGS